MAEKNNCKKTRKGIFIEALEKSLGVITVAAKKVGVRRETIWKWMKEDPDFKARVDAVNDIQCDFVESKLLKLIREDDPNAIIFYLRTKGKRRGYTERGDVEREKPAEEPKNISQTIQIKIESKKQEIITLLKSEGKYTPELLLQVESAAQLTVRRDILANEIFSEGYTPVTIEYSREGSVRQSANPKETMYQDYCAQLQKALKALGMNTDAKERSTDGGDTSADFLTKHRIEQ